MIDVEFATLGIIRCNVGDSARLHLNALGREMGRLRHGSWCFMVSCFSFSWLWLSDNNSEKQRSAAILCATAAHPSSCVQCLETASLKCTKELPRADCSPFQLRVWLSYEVYNHFLTKRRPKATYISVVCDMTRLRFLCLLHDILLILFVSRQVVVSKSHFVNQFFFSDCLFFKWKNKLLILSVLFLDTAGLIANC